MSATCCRSDQRFALIVIVSVFLRLVSNHCPCLFFIFNLVLMKRLFNRNYHLHILSVSVLDVTNCSVSLFCIFLCHISVSPFTFLSLRTRFFLHRINSLDITECRSEKLKNKKRLRERAGRKYRKSKITIHIINLQIC